ncbi:hypothetical protein [Paraburkholderia caribensis]|uniref:hypothetical protein n=1 Tax=Paraburkholderia caribensis TaxID=75105 RepID=UPI0006D3F71C
MNPLHSRPATGASGTSAAQEAAQTQRGVTEPARQQTRARFATSLRNNVRFAHAHHAHLQGQARSANARRLAQALLKKRQGKAAATQFAAARRPATSRSGGNARAAQNTRTTDRQRSAALRVSRDGGNGGSRGGGQQQDDQQQQQQRQQQRQQGKHDDDLMLDGADGTTNAARVVPEFAARALTLAGSTRHEALAGAWCDALLKPGRSLHDALSQLRALRRHEGALPLASLAQVRQSLMDATARAAATRQAGEASQASAAGAAARANASTETRNVLAPLLALVAGSPMLPNREGRAVGANAALDGIARARNTLPAGASGPDESAR